jgi:hypothetical protein
VLGGPGNPKKGPWTDAEKSAVSYYPYPTIAWDYINRAMPANKPGSLTRGPGVFSDNREDLT